MESGGIERRWLVAYCKSRNEKLSAERLAISGIEVYCPLQDTMRQWSDRKKKVKTPIFPSYIFVYVNEEERIKVLKDSGVSRFVFWLGKPAVIRKKEMADLKHFIEENAGVEREFIIREGQQVRIESGPFKNQKGVVSELKGNIPKIVIEDLGITLIANSALQISEE